MPCVFAVSTVWATPANTPAARVAAREAEVDGIAFMRFLIAFLRCFLNVENAGILPFEIGEGTVLPGMQTSGVRRDLRIALCQIYKVEPGLSAGVLRAGDPGRIIELVCPAVHGRSVQELLHLFQRQEVFFRRIGDQDIR